MKINIHLVFCMAILGGLCHPAFAQYTIATLDSNKFIIGDGVILSKTSFRGLSVVNDQTVWVSGSRGTIAISNDGGQTFKFSQLKKYEKSDFRDIEAFDANKAIIMSSGTPAVILKTSDGGKSWIEVFRKNESAYFLDAMDFWDNKKGIIVGDPINGHFVLLQTNDGGDTWQVLDTNNTPKAKDGEAVFAASGTSLRCWGTNEFSFVTGGLSSAIYIGEIKTDRQIHYRSIKIPMATGKPSKGSFSLAYKGYKSYIIVGGDYMADSLSTYNLVIGQMVTKGCIGNYEFNGYSNYLNGYKSSVELIDKKKSIFIATGTKGVDIGNTDWKTISSEAFHVVRKAKNGKAVFLAGPKGKIGRLIY